MDYDVTHKSIDHDRPGATGGIPGPCPPNDCLCPPKRGLCPEEINRLGASGVQIESQIAVFCGLTTDFMTFFLLFFVEYLFSTAKTAWISDFGRKIPRKIGEDLFLFLFFFFLKITCCRPEKPLEFPIESLAKRWRPFFFLETTCFRPEISLEFLVPPCPSRIHIHKLLVPPQNLFLPPPPVTLFWRRAWITTLILTPYRTLVQPNPSTLWWIGLQSNQLTLANL